VQDNHNHDALRDGQQVGLSSNFTGSMANHSDRWYFSKEQIKSSPSVKDGIEHSKELGYRQQCANLVQDIGQRLQVYINLLFLVHSYCPHIYYGPLNLQIFSFWNRYLVDNHITIAYYSV